jgi:hypothetical protein
MKRTTILLAVVFIAAAWGCGDKKKSCDCLPSEICVSGECIPLGDAVDDGIEDLVEEPAGDDSIEDVASDEPVVEGEVQEEDGGGDVPDLTDGEGDDDADEDAGDAAEEVELPPCDTVRCSTAGECGDGNVCSEDWCDPYTACCIYFTDTMNFYPCSDGVFCNGGEYCLDGECTSEPLICEGETACAVATCDEDADACVYAPKPDGTPCDDGLRCTGDNNVCAGGLCDITDPCPEDPGTCLINNCYETGRMCRGEDAPDGTVCADEDPCNGTEYCHNARCNRVVPPCFDGDPCTVDACDPDTGECPLEPAVIEDCTDCTGDPDCADWNECTLDYCRNVGGEIECEHVFNPMCPP